MITVTFASIISFVISVVSWRCQRTVLERWQYDDHPAYETAVLKTVDPCMICTCSL